MFSPYALVRSTVPFEDDITGKALASDTHKARPARSLEAPRARFMSGA